MARHKQQGSAAQYDAPADQPTIPGGAAGVPTDETSRQTPRARRPSDEPERVATQYMVTDGPRGSDGKIPFNSEGYVVYLRPGKIVSETTHDLALMRRQGIVLEAMPSEADEEVLQEEAPTEEQPPAG